MPVRWLAAVQTAIRQMLVKQVRKDRVTIEEAAEDAGMTVEESAWFYGYYNRKSNDNLPTLTAIAEMSEADVNSLLPGYHIDQLREVWGKPDTSENSTASATIQISVWAH